MIRVSGTKQSNQVGELAAAIKAISSLPSFNPLTIITDSKYVIDGLMTHLKTWEDNGWIGVENTQLFKRAAYLLQRRTATTSFKWVKGHRGNLGNEESDKLAKEGANKGEPNYLPMDVPIKYDLQGAKLVSLTQAIAYKGIKERNPIPPHPAKSRNLETIRTAIQEFQHTLETNETIWNSIRKCTI